MSYLPNLSAGVIRDITAVRDSQHIATNGLLPSGWKCPNICVKKYDKCWCDGNHNCYCTRDGEPPVFCAPCKK